MTKKQIKRQTFKPPYIYLVATVELGAAAVRFLGLGVVPSRNPFLQK